MHMGQVISDATDPPGIVQLILSYPTIFTMPIEFVSVSQDSKTDSVSHFLLRLFNHCRLKFENFPASCAHEMIVVFVFDLVTRHTIIKTTLFGQAGLYKQLQRAVNRRVADSGVLVSNQLIEVFASEVAARFEKRLEDHLALLRLLEVVTLKISRKRFLLEFVGHQQEFSRPLSFGPEIEPPPVRGLQNWGLGSVVTSGTVDFPPPSPADGNAQQLSARANRFSVRYSRLGVSDGASEPLPIRSPSMKSPPVTISELSR